MPGPVLEEHKTFASPVLIIRPLPHARTVHDLYALLLSSTVKSIQRWASKTRAIHIPLYGEINNGSKAVSLRSPVADLLRPASETCAGECPDPGIPLDWDAVLEAITDAICSLRFSSASRCLLSAGWPI